LRNRGGHGLLGYWGPPVWSGWCILRLTILKRSSVRICGVRLGVAGPTWFLRMWPVGPGNGWWRRTSNTSSKGSMVCIHSPFRLWPKNWKLTSNMSPTKVGPWAWGRPTSRKTTPPGRAACAVTCGRLHHEGGSLCARTLAVVQWCRAMAMGAPISAPGPAMAPTARCRSRTSRICGCWP
jgi:hypothetical protein